MSDGFITGETLYHVWKNSHPRLTHQQVGMLFNLTQRQVANRIWTWQQTQKGMIQAEQPRAFDFDLGEPLALTGDAVIVSDIQAPCTNLDMARLVIPVAQHHGIKRLIMNGDTINVDWLSKYPVKVTLPSAQQEIKAAAVLIEEWLHWFDEIVFLPGNHEDRFLKANAGNLEMRNLLQLITTDSRVVTSNFDHLTLDTPAGKWFICHGTNYSVNQLTVAEGLAHKYEANIIVAHQHHLAKGWDRFKRYVLIDNGGLFDQRKMAFATLRASKLPNMQNGFAVLQDGYASLYGPEPYTDWRAILEESIA